MLDRIHRLNISLAAKCQLLFGAAVVLIIAAALFVPWQRMEHLTDQINNAAAAAVAESVVRQHVISADAHGPITDLLTRPPKTVRINGVESIPPRLIGLTTPEKELTPWEHSVQVQLSNPASQRIFYREYIRRDRANGFRYAAAVSLKQDCLRCHAQAASATTEPTIIATNHYFGFVSVDIPSQIPVSQILLNRVILLIAGMLAGLMAFVVFYVITTRIILQPVRVLQETAEKVSEGDLNIRSDINTGDEFQQLSETFNTMLANLSENADQLRTANKALDLRVGQLAESNVMLYESNRLKSEFLANVSHELRTPLNSILGFAELLKDVTAADNKSSRYVQNIQQSGKNLLELINDLLDLAKIEAGKMEVRSEPLSLPDLFEGLASIMKPVTEARTVTLTCSVSPEMPIVKTDPPKLQQVLYNFLSNAIKFSPPSGTIGMTAELTDGGEVRIQVTDQGPGIAPEMQDVIFEKFRQIDGSVTRQHNGTGLGLAISKELVALLEGRIGVQSDIGRGATFWVTLPRDIQARVHDVRAVLS